MLKTVHIIFAGVVTVLAPPAVCARLSQRY